MMDGTGYLLMASVEYDEIYGYDYWSHNRLDISMVINMHTIFKTKYDKINTTDNNCNIKNDITFIV